MANIIDKIFKFDKKMLNKYKAQSEKVLAYEKEMAELTDEQLKDKTFYFRKLFNYHLAISINVIVTYCNCCAVSVCQTIDSCFIKINF